MNTPGNSFPVTHILILAGETEKKPDETTLCSRVTVCWLISLVFVGGFNCVCLSFPFLRKLNSPIYKGRQEAGKLLTSRQRFEDCLAFDIRLHNFNSSPVKKTKQFSSLSQTKHHTKSPCPKAGTLTKNAFFKH